MGNMSDTDIHVEAQRLYAKLKYLNWQYDDCVFIAPITTAITRLKQEQHAIILAHSYQKPEIMYGVADNIGDSYTLSRKAMEDPAEKIIFSSVYFMAETAKLLNPQKTVLVPQIAGCSLADSISAQDIQQLRTQYPDAGVVCYINSYAEVKAASDACCTSSNAAAVVEAMPEKEIIFLPDELMGENLRNMTHKTLIPWQGRCIVHETFNPAAIHDIRRRYSGVKILAHPECTPGVIALVDYAGGTAGMLEYVRNSSAQTFMLVTECGLTDRFKAEFPDKTIVGTCILCPYMKMIQLEDILTALESPIPEQYIEIPQQIAVAARKSLHRMFELEKLGRKLLKNKQQDSEP